jgi:membrane fusion protein (multidrug efflux system)
MSESEKEGKAPQADAQARNPDAPAPQAPSPATNAGAPAKKGPPKPVLGVAVLAVLVGLYFAWDWWRYARTHVTTENAYVRADVTPVSARIGGTVSEVPVDSNDAVRKGDVLLHLDTTDLDLAVSAAEARLGQARTQVEVYRATVKQERANVAMAAAEAERARTDLERTANLAKQQVVSTQSLDHARTAYSVAESRRVATVRALDRALSALDGNPDLPTEEQCLVREARAALDQARQNLSYAVVTASANGYISQRRVQVGQRVQPGQPLMALVELDDPYVVANFKETEITDIRIGQTAEIRVDVYPDVVYTGRVDSIDSGTGAAFALLPPQNASGNWVKVVQRVPVKIVLEEAPRESHPLRIGLSAEVAVNTEDRSGALLRAHESTLRRHLRAEATPQTEGVSRAEPATGAKATPSTRSALRPDVVSQAHAAPRVDEAPHTAGTSQAAASLRNAPGAVLPGATAVGRVATPQAPGPASDLTHP